MTHPHDAETLSNGLPPPPIPQRLREMLKDCPRHLELLQKDLNEVVESPFLVTPIFEQAIWALEGRTSAFIREAQTELEAAQASGDAEAIALAEAKELLMGMAGSSGVGLLNLSELSAYFKLYGDVIR